MLSYQAMSSDQLGGGVVQAIWSLISQPGELLPVQQYTLTPYGAVELLLLRSGKVTNIHPYPVSDLMTGVPYLLGVLDRSVHFSLSGSIDIFGIRLIPGLARTVIQKSLRQFVNRLTPLCTVDGDLATAVQRLGAIATLTQQAEVVQQFFLPYQQRITAQGQLISQLIQRMVQTGGRGELSQWCHDQAIHTRTLERLFRQETGLPPKHYSRLIRLWWSLQTQVQQPVQRLTQLAVQSGFYDQSHFIKEFTDLMSELPGRFFRKTQAITSTLFQKQ